MKSKGKNKNKNKNPQNNFSDYLLFIIPDAAATLVGQFCIRTSFAMRRAPLPMKPHFFRNIGSERNGQSHSFSSTNSTDPTQEKQTMHS